jgi:hypothetical protein
MATLLLINNNALIVPRGDYEDATEVIGADHKSADGTLTPDMWGLRWGLKFTLVKPTAIKDAVWGLYLNRTIFPVRDEVGTVRQCLIPHGKFTFTRIHMGDGVDPYYRVVFTVREQ